MPTIFQRPQKDGTTSFQVKVRIKGQPQLTATFATKGEARRWGRKTERTLLQYLEAERMTDALRRALEAVTAKPFGPARPPRKRLER